MKISREKFLSELEAVSPGLCRKPTVEQGTCFVFDGKRVCTFNDEIACTSPTQLKGVVGAITAAPLLSLLRKMGEETIDVRVKDESLKIKGKGRGASLVMQSDVTLPIDRVGKPDAWAPLHDEFNEAVSLVVECASDDQSQYAYTCLHFTPKFVEAMDNHQVGRYKLKTGFDGDAYIRKVACRPIVELDMCEFGTSDGWAHFRNKNKITLSCLLSNSEDFLDLAPFLQADGVKTRLPKGLELATEKAAVFLEDKDEPDVEVHVAEGELVVRGSGAAGKYWERRKIKYDGPPLSFAVSAKLLGEISKKYRECEISESRLRVNGGKFTYVSCLNPIEEKK